MPDAISRTSRTGTPAQPEPASAGRYASTRFRTSIWPRSSRSAMSVDASTLDTDMYRWTSTLRMRVRFEDDLASVQNQNAVDRRLSCIVLQRQLSRPGGGDESRDLRSKRHPQRANRTAAQKERVVEELGHVQERVAHQRPAIVPVVEIPLTMELRGFGRRVTALLRSCADRQRKCANDREHQSVHGSCSFLR